MILSITRINDNDYGEYHCIVKNEYGVQRGIFHVYGKTYKPLLDHTRVAIYGDPAPARESYEELCPPASKCEQCPDPRSTKCKDQIVSVYDLIGGHLVMKNLNTSYPGLSNRSLGECA